MKIWKILDSLRGILSTKKCLFSSVVSLSLIENGGLMLVQPGILVIFIVLSFSAMKVPCNIIKFISPHLSIFKKNKKSCLHFYRLVI